MRPDDPARPTVRAGGHSSSETQPPLDRHASEILEEAYRDLRGGLLRFCAGLLNSREDAEDAVQETFLWAAQPVASRARQPSAYLYAVARHVCYDIRRRRHHHEELTADTVARDAGPDTVAVDRRILVEVWSALSARDRLLLASRAAGFEYAEIARRSGLSAKSVSVGLVRARDRVRRARDGLRGVFFAGTLSQGLERARRFWHERHAAVQTITQIVSSRTAGELASLVAATCLVFSGAPAPGQAGVGNAVVASAPGIADTAGRIAGSPGQTGTSSRLLAGAPPHAARKNTASAAPAPAGPMAPPAAATDLLPPTGVQAVTPSPHYGSDHTLFLEGTGGENVPSLFKSEDGGAHWMRVLTAGFGGGRIILPPAWPQDPRMYAGTPLGLEESDDAGAVWRPVVPVPGPVAVEPDPVGSGYRVAIAAADAVWTYETSVGSLRRGPALPLGVWASSVAFAGDGQHVVIGGSNLTTAHGVVLRCDLVVACQVIFDRPQGGPVSVVTPSQAPSDAVATVDLLGTVAISSDGGATFASVDTGGRLVDAVSIVAVDAGDQTLALSYRVWQGSRFLDKVAVVHTDGGQAVDLPSLVNTFHVDMAAILTLAGGRTLIVQRESFGIPVAWYTDDGGKMWHTTAACPGNC